MARTNAIGLRRDPPAADADGHAIGQLGDDLIGGHRLVPLGHSSSVHKRLARLVGDAAEVELEGESLFETI
jgi:hypothetical protein